MESHADPQRRVEQDARVGHAPPQVLVRAVALGRGAELAELLDGGARGQQLPGVLVEVDLVQHELARLLLVGQLVDQREVVGSHVFVDVQGWGVRQRPLVLGIAWVKNTVDGTGMRVLVLLGVDQVVWNPASIHENGASLAILVQMRVERCGNLVAFLTVLGLLDSDLALMVVNALNCNWLHGVVLLELGDVLGTGPEEVCSIRWGDVLGRLREELGPARGLVLIVLAMTTLVSLELVGHHKHWQ